MSVTSDSGGIVATTTNGDRLELKSDGIGCPALVLEVDDLEAARLFLESRPNRASYEDIIEITQADGRAFIELRDPDSVQILIVDKS